MSLAGKNAIVTGGASGIGLATCRRLAREGVGIGIFDVDLAGAERAAAELKASGARAVACRVDVSARAQINAGLERVHGELGPVLILVNNAGITSFKPFVEVTEAEWDRVMFVNLKSMFLCTQAVLPDMLSAGWGRIINVSSSSAQTGSARMTTYASSKGGVIAFTKSLALELATAGITVNNIPPGFVETPMLLASTQDIVGGIAGQAERSPMKKPGRPEDVAAACAFLASEEAGYITGHTLSVNGGRYMA
ncbi:MAG TPA: SDR family NAD(P)-dependent oxidoreductase [Steroidobacteraceae bacterium]|nr:SDR family NAD(P)-dependent oxidoreductase [Steroidobacteraceae bacterium]